MSAQKVKNRVLYTLMEYQLTRTVNWTVASKYHFKTVESNSKNKKIAFRPKYSIISIDI